MMANACILWRDGKRYILGGDDAPHDPLPYLLDTQRAMLDELTAIKAGQSEIRDELAGLRTRINVLLAETERLP